MFRQGANLPLRAFPIQFAGDMNHLNPAVQQSLQVLSSRAILMFLRAATAAENQQGSCGTGSSPKCLSPSRLVSGKPAV